MGPVVRFAPSPTGLLHVGNARTAIINALFARKTGGRFLLRIDDTDRVRSKTEYEEAILADLAWLGVSHADVTRQSSHLVEYEARFEELKAKGHVYPAYETEGELARARKLAAARHLPPVYDRAALDPAKKARWEGEGRAPHWRFRLSRSKITWTDLIRGEVEIDTATQSDPVVRRADGTFLYTFPSVVDDVRMGITHVIRGEDHVTNTAAQVEIFRALGVPPPAFAHHPLLVGAGGQALSKRIGSLSLKSLREEGLEAQAIASYLARIGTSDPVAPRLTLDELAADFDFARIGRAPAHFDEAELKALNAALLHQLPFAAVDARLAAMGVAAGPELWEAIQHNLTVLADAGMLVRLVTGPVMPVIEDTGLIAAAIELLPPEPWGPDTWGVWTKALSARTGAKGRALYHPLRLALTGLESGPEMKKLLPLIGRSRSLARLEGTQA